MVLFLKSISCHLNQDTSHLRSPQVNIKRIGTSIKEPSIFFITFEPSILSKGSLIVFASFLERGFLTKLQGFSVIYLSL